MKNKFYIMVGVAGAGKTTYAKKKLANCPTYYISRDEIRFSKINSTDKYFAKEKEVFDEFVYKINASLNAGTNYNVIADATHLTIASRRKLLSKLFYNKNKTETIAVVINTPLHKCIEQNNQRRGTKAYVSPNIIDSMYQKLVIPKAGENGIDKVIIINEEEE